MRLTLRTDLAIRTLMTCAVNPDRLIRKADIARVCHVSENHLAHVILDLSRLELIQTTRGRNGGLRLARTPDEIDIGMVIRSLESELPFIECRTANVESCPIGSVCRMKGHFGRALEAFYAALDGTSLADLISESRGIDQLLCLEAADV